MQLSAANLEISRTHPQSTDLYLSIFSPQTAMACMVDLSSGTTNIGSMDIPYTSVSEGSYLSVESGMTMLVGTSAGDDDVGKIRVRSAGTGTISVAENSNINWPIATHLTVLRYWEVWPIYPRIASDTVATDVTFYKDWDIPYTNQNDVLGTLASAGSHRAGWAGDQFYWSASGTTHLITGTTMTYDWAFEGGTPTGSTSHTPGYVTYNTPGHYVTRLIITGNNGSTDTTYRYVSIYNRPENSISNNPIKKWEANPLSGARGEGGSSTSIRIIDATAPTMRDGDVVVIFSDDWYGSNHVSLGGNSLNNSSIFFVGHIVNGSIRYDYKTSVVEFEVASITAVMKSVEGFSITVESKSNPSKWFELIDMDGRRAMYHYLRWHSTVLYIADFEFRGNDQRVQFFDSARESVFDAVDNYMRTALAGSVCADRQGKLWAEVGAWAYSNPTGSFPVIQEITKRDWINEPTILERRNAPLSSIECGGVVYDTGSASGTFLPILSQAPGISPNTRGTVENIQGLTLESQIQLNELTGNLFANKNSVLPSIEMGMAGNYRQFDIAPVEAVDINILAGDTNKGIAIHAPYLVDSLTWQYSPKNKIMIPDAGLISLVNGLPGVTVNIPIVPDDDGYGDGGGGDGGVDFPIDPPPPPSLCTDPTASNFGGPLPCQYVELPCNHYSQNYFPLGWSVTDMRGDVPSTLVSRAPFSCILRSSYTQSYIYFSGKWWGDANTKYNVYGTMGGSRIITAQVTHSATNNRAVFYPISDTQVDGFEIELDAGLGSIVSYELGGNIGAGTAQAYNNQSVQSVALTVGNYYSVDGYGGPWYGYPFGDPNYKQNFYFQIYDLSSGRQSGAVGYDGVAASMRLENGSIGMFSAPINANYARIIFQAVDAGIYFRASADPNPTDNSGTISYTIKPAIPTGRRIEIGGSQIHNVCAV